MPTYEQLDLMGSKITERIKRAVASGDAYAQARLLKLKNRINLMKGRANGSSKHAA